MSSPFTLRNLLTLGLLSGLALAAPAAEAQKKSKRDNGGVNWTNNCASNVYFEIAGPGFSIGPYTLAPGQTSYNQQPPISGNGDGGVAGGYSAKFNFDQDWSVVYQFEYASDGTYVWYDFSAQNGDPFLGAGSSIVPSGGNSGSDPTDCPTVTCPAGDDSTCAYQGTDPSGPVHHCTVDTTVDVYLC